MTERTMGDLRQKQSLPLNAKISMSNARIREWHEYYDGNVCVDFSGGIDSTVMLKLVRNLYPDVPGVYMNTGLEYPEIRKFVDTIPNITVLNPSMTFRQVIENYGYPVISKEVAHTLYYAKRGSVWATDRLNGVDKNGNESKYRHRFKKYAYLNDAPFNISHMCCVKMKEEMLNKYHKKTNTKPFIGVLAEESTRRTQSWLRTGCNAFDSSNIPHSMPLSFWTKQDVLQYIYENDIKIASVYGDVVKEFVDGKPVYKTTGVDRTGCMFCMFGVHLEDHPNRFEKMRDTHPRLYNYCINGGTEDEHGMWVPDDKGLGLGRILDYLNVRH